MNNPLQIHNDLKSTYLKYIGSGIPFFHEQYDNERRKLMEEVGTVCQPPIIELIPRYQETVSLKDFCQKENVPTELADFVQAGLFYGGMAENRLLYKHQYNSLKEAFINRRNIVVTTGTGSGKTECFLLPILADLVKESETWRKERPRAVRALILYPLNALAEDQMVRLRKALNSRRDGEGALDWLDSYRNSHRFYFGRYTGSTPVSGEGDTAKKAIKEGRTKLRAEWESIKEQVRITGQTELLYHVPCMEDDSAEMWDRLSMQAEAPDILITNYSMLNIILMRELEAPIFEKTKQWLKEDPSHVFHLVIDELHTYRGTAGTEVAFLIRVLLDRLGLTPDSPQVQFLASSASMEDTQQTKDFICEFFGTDKTKYDEKFRMFSNERPQRVYKPSKVIPEIALEKYLSSNKSEEDSDKELFEETGCNSHLEIVRKYELDNWLKYSLSDSEGNIVAKDIEYIANKLVLQSENPLLVTAAMIKILCNAKTEKGALLPMRAHLFFRAINGLWSCSNPECEAVAPEYRFVDRLCGKLYKSPRGICSCGHRVLETIVCESCGEAFLGGYIVKRNDKNYLVPDKPVGENDTLYGVLWVSEENVPDWVKVNYNSETGEFAESPRGKYLLYKQENPDSTPRPCKCPQCEVEYKADKNSSFTPLKKHSVGLQKVNQVLADALIRSMKSANEKNSKVVLFSDSRQAAAKLSAGIELDHFRDAVRWLMIKSLNGDRDTYDFLLEFKDPERFVANRTERKRLRNIAAQGYFEELVELILEKEELEDSEKTRLDFLFTTLENISLEYVTSNVFKGLLEIGSNPAGPKPSMARDDIAGHWSDVIDLENFRLKVGATEDEKVFYDKLRLANRQEQIMSVFAHKKKSFESMKLGYLCMKDPTGLDNQAIEFINSVIRILGEKRRISGFDSRYPLPKSFPRVVRKRLKQIYGITNQQAQTEKLEELKQIMRNRGIIDKDYVTLTGSNIAFSKASVGSDYWICPRCKTVHMQHSNGYCINCLSPLGTSKKLTEGDFSDPDDYYLALLNSTEKIYRLHCEELTGQTSKEDSRKRQRLFQDIFLEDEQEKIEGIDILSVTTTMEAGVDIGSLSAVMMGNVPPQRFNYQQRVGRAGRRGHPLSVALTIAKDSSHDITHYFETERMVSSTPKSPYLEVRIKEIAERIIIKEVLYEALKSNSSSRESVHGSFGTVADWLSTNHRIVSHWINRNQGKIDYIIGMVTKSTDITEADKGALKSSILEELVERITKVCESEDFTQYMLSERLANAGMLPMFGFPTRTRNLFLSEPRKLPASDVVSRDMDMAINSFAPGHEIVKDKLVYKSVGVADYEYNRYGLSYKTSCLNEYSNPLMSCKKCGYSTLQEVDETCPICSEKMDRIKVCSPLGFCVDYNEKPQDFNGSFDWYSPNSDIRLDCEDNLENCEPIRNLEIRNNVIPSNGLVHQINDNNGHKFQMGLNRSNIWIDRNAYPEEVRNKLNLRALRDLVFVSSKTTGVMALSFLENSSNLCLDPVRNQNLRHIVKSAFLSWGFLVRRSIASYLDIEASELEVGYQISKNTKKPEIFLVEQLENGSGYCNYLSGRKFQEIPFEAIVSPLIEGGNIYELLCSPSHMHGCLTSCYDCIRDFSNQMQHNLLNWRLGLDIAQIVNNANMRIDFNLPYWKIFLEENLEGLLKRKHFTLERREELYLVIRNGELYGIVTHPLWNQEYTINLLIENDLRTNLEQFSIIDLCSL